MPNFSASDLFCSPRLVIPRATSCRCCSVQTLRVSNISEDTKEADLQELFEPFGSIYRIYLAKDKDPPHHSRGFAFVSYNRREDAELAMSRLQVSKKMEEEEEFIVDRRS